MSLAIQLLYFVHIITDTERLVDYCGGDYSDLSHALVEAEEDARSIVSEALRTGADFPRRWRIQIADGEGRVVASATFAQMLGLPEGGCPHRPAKVDSSTMREARRSYDEIIGNLGALQQQLDALGRILG